MYYYVIYDFNDNLVAYCDNKIELSRFCGIPINSVNYRFKNRNFIKVVISNKFFKVYRFI